MNRHSQAERDIKRAAAEAAERILDGRDPVKDRVIILDTLATTIAILLITAMEDKPRAAARALNEVVVPDVELNIMSGAADPTS